VVLVAAMSKLLSYPLALMQVFSLMWNLMISLMTQRKNFPFCFRIFMERIEKFGGVVTKYLALVSLVLDKRAKSCDHLKIRDLSAMKIITNRSLAENK